MAGTWTYDPATLATSKLFQVRRLIGDVLIADQQIFDEEITLGLTLNGGSIYRAGAECCRMIASQYARKVDLVEGDRRLTYSTQTRNYEARAAALDRLATIRGGGIPYAGGVSVMDKVNNYMNTDRTQPSFNVGMVDSWLPVGPAGNEVPGGNPGPLVFP